MLVHALVLTTILLTLAGDRAHASGDRIVRVGIYQNNPKIFIDDEEQPAGFFIDLLQEIARQEGWELVYIPCNWADCLDILEQGQIDLMPDVAYTAERDLMFDFHQTPALESWSQLYARRRREIENLADLDGKRVAVLRGSVQEQVFAEMMQGYGYTITLVPTDSIEEAFALADDGSVDAAIANRLFGEHYYQEYGLVKTPVIFNLALLYYATAEGQNQDLLAAIDQHLNAWLEEAGSYYYIICTKWAGGEVVYRVPNAIYWGLGVFGLVVLMAAAMIVLLRRQVRVRTAHLEKTLASLHESEQRYKMISSITSDYLFASHLDDQGKLTLDWTAGAFEEITGYTPEDYIVHGGWRAALHSDDLAQDERDLENLNLNQPVVTEIRTITKDGRVVWVRVSAQPVVDEHSGELTGIYGAVQDITGRKQAEQVLQQYNERLEKEVEARTRDLQDAQEALVRQEKLATLGQLAGGVGHELRNPLSAINNAVYYLKLIQPEADEKVLDYLAMIENEIKTAVAIINDLLEFSLLKTTLKETVPAAELVQSVLERFPPTEGVQVTREIPAGVPPLAADRRHMEQVLGNLVVNAYQAMPEGGRLVISVRQAGKTLVLTVKDSGTGISAENIKKIFEPLFTTKPKGIGLGLAVSKKMVEANGGSIEVQSQPGEGTTFQVHLPIKPEEEK